MAIYYKHWGGAGGGIISSYMNEESMIYDFTKIDKVRLLKEYLTQDYVENCLQFQQGKRKGRSAVDHGYKCFHFLFCFLLVNLQYPGFEWAWWGRECKRCFKN